MHLHTKEKETAALVEDVLRKARHEGPEAMKTPYCALPGFMDGSGCLVFGVEPLPPPPPRGALLAGPVQVIGVRNDPPAPGAGWHGCSHTPAQCQRGTGGGGAGTELSAGEQMDCSWRTSGGVVCNTTQQIAAASEINAGVHGVWPPALVVDNKSKQKLFFKKIINSAWLPLFLPHWHLLSRMSCEAKVLGPAGWGGGGKHGPGHPGWGTSPPGSGLAHTHRCPPADRTACNRRQVFQKND